MAQTLSTELTGSTSLPVVKPAVPGYGSRLRRFRASIALAAQASGDTVVLARVPAGHAFAFGVLTTDTSLATATVAVGTAASSGKYKAAAVQTATETPAIFGTTAQIIGTGLTAEEVIIATIAVASLPGAGNLVIDLFFSNA